MPELRTLRQKLEGLQFHSGILHEVFHFLKMKISFFTDNNTECSLVLDEMSITPGQVYDNSSQSYVGKVTSPAHEGEAMHALVFMLGGFAR